jgi:hypothetical protein
MIPVKRSSFGRTGGRRRYRGAPRTPASWLPSAGQSQNVAPLPAGSHLQSEPQNEPERTAPRPSSPGPCRFPTKAICCRIFTPALPDCPVASVRDFCSGDFIPPCTMRIAGSRACKSCPKLLPIKTRSYTAAVPRPVSCSRLRRKFSVIVYRASPCDQTIAPGRGKASPFRTLQCFSAIVARCSLSDAEVGGGAVRRGGRGNRIVVDQHLPRGRGREACDHVQQGRLAAAGRGFSGPEGIRPALV